MKTILSTVLLLTLLTTTSCKKDWFCRCSYELQYFGKQPLGGEEYEKTSKEEAEKRCKEKEESIKNAQLPGPENTVCVIEENK
ncbi:MAG: hypothetical protein H6551_03040 [Chitinophagales bacterium]|nr:hypothetical protein [Chitinophagales bacterium]